MPADPTPGPSGDGGATGPQAPPARRGQANLPVRPATRLGSALLALIWLDARGIARDGVLLVNILATGLVVGSIAVVGLFKAHDPAWAAWFPILLALAILTGPPSWGLLFGLVLVDENDNGTRAALAVTPVPPAWILTLRGLLMVFVPFGWLVVSVLMMTAAWGMDNLTLGAIGLLSGAQALATPATALTLAALSRNKVEAIALYKGINFLVLAPFALYLLPDESFFRTFFFILPAAWGLTAFETLRRGEPAMLGLLGTTLFHLVLVAFAMRAFTRARP